MGSVSGAKRAVGGHGVVKSSVDPRSTLPSPASYDSTCSLRLRDGFVFCDFGDENEARDTDKDSTELSELIDVIGDGDADQVSTPVGVEIEEPPTKKRKTLEREPPGSKPSAPIDTEEEDRKLALRLQKEWATTEALPTTRSRTRRTPAPIPARPKPEKEIVKAKPKAKTTKVSQRKTVNKNKTAKKPSEANTKAEPKPAPKTVTKKSAEKSAPKKTTRRPKKRTRGKDVACASKPEVKEELKSCEKKEVEEKAESEDDGLCARMRPYRRNRDKMFGKPLETLNSCGWNEPELTDREKRKQSRDHVRTMHRNGFQNIESLKENELKRCMKRTYVGESRIHGRGLFAAENIEENGFVMEFIGQVIRPVVADLRERQYQRSGIGSSYLFQLDANRILDATTCGSTGRYINHSCFPNVYARKQVVNGQLRILFFAKKPITKSQEITYDYNFVTDEAKKERCQCNASTCRGFI